MREVLMMTAKVRMVALIGAIAGIVSVGLGIGLGVVLTTGALATHDDQNELHACVSRISGAMRYADNPAQCTRYERVVSWEQSSDAGDGGEPGISGYEIVSQLFQVASGGGQLMQVPCPDGKQVLGGGYHAGPFEVTSTQQGLEARINQPADQGRDPAWISV